MCFWPCYNELRRLIMSVDQKYETIVAQMRGAIAAERIQVRGKIDELESAVASLKIQVENAPIPAAVDYSQLEALLADIKGILPDDPMTTEAPLPNTEPLLPNSAVDDSESDEAPILEL